ncbi:MAG: metallophosphoesterase [Thermoprotei archaeon]|jgi:predicted MPP superfamily phosphohydrolase
MVRLSRRKFLLMTSGVAVTSVVYSFAETYFFEINEVNIPLGLNLRVLHITDLHVKDWGFKDEIFKAISDFSSNVDVTFITGDFYDKYTRTLEVVKNYVSKIKGVKIGVLGNHEYWAHNVHPLETGIKVLEDSGVKILRNEKIKLKGVSIGGIDWYHDENGLGKMYLSEIGDADVLLSHTPDVIALKPKVRLILAGHTHGGQVCLPFIGPLWAPSKYGTKYASGLFKEENIYMYVNKGVGEIIPIRFNCRREIALLNL